MADVETYMAAVNRAYRSERGRKDMRDDYQRNRQMQQPVRASLHSSQRRDFFRGLLRAISSGTAAAETSGPAEAAGSAETSAAGGYCP
ncbi:hypothetical protein F511_20651 [Dorcoceras hygrometricum]|uniref:Uncharacterized protein n=1 Tax=Dorcoceras hygrometricum TaxID=472368 RepID=A0A2Z7D1A3_9LAMI|nr:hypothetical protein F511_20651 [Dorcoceras hygrometricum]